MRNINHTNLYELMHDTENLNQIKGKLKKLK